MYLAIKVRIYPTPDQESHLAQCFGNTRWLWNYMLNLTSTQYKETGKGLSRKAMQDMLPGLKKEIDWLGLVYSQTLQSTVLNLSTAFINFFEGRAKYPTPKNKHGRQSIQYPQNVKIQAENSILKFPGTLGSVKTKFHQAMPEGKYTTITVSRNCDGRYYASILFDRPNESIPAKNHAIGVDLGLKTFAVTSDGSEYQLPKKTLGKLEKNRKRKQKKLARKTDRTSQNYKKNKRLVAKISSKIARVREDFLHKLSRKIAYENQVICVENLAVKNMMKNHCLAKAIADQGWGMFLNMLKYKAQRFGHVYQEIGRFFPSSQLCNETLLPLPMLQKGFDSLAVRSVDCPHCKKKHDRDVNAAINIRNEGLRILEFGTPSTDSGDTVRPKKSGRKKSTVSEAGIYEGIMKPAL
jgi:putative transposase